MPVFYVKKRTELQTGRNDLDLIRKTKLSIVL